MERRKGSPCAALLRARARPGPVPLLPRALEPLPLREPGSGVGRAPWRTVERAAVEGVRRRREGARPAGAVVVFQYLCASRGVGSDCRPPRGGSPSRPAARPAARPARRPHAHTHAHTLERARTRRAEAPRRPHPQARARHPALSRPRATTGATRGGGRALRVAVVSRRDRALSSLFPPLPSSPPSSPLSSLFPLAVLACRGLRGSSRRRTGGTEARPADHGPPGTGRAGGRPETRSGPQAKGQSCAVVHCGLYSTTGVLPVPIAPHLYDLPLLQPRTC